MILTFDMSNNYNIYNNSLFIVSNNTVAVAWGRVENKEIWETMSLHNINWTNENGQLMGPLPYIKKRKC